MAQSRKRGLASAPQKVRKQVAHEGGEARAQEFVHKGYQELGAKGGKASRKHKKSGQDAENKEGLGSKIIDLLKP